MVDDQLLAGIAAFKERRREGREPAEGTVKISGRRFRLVDWSSSGFQAQGPASDLNEGDRVSLEFSIVIGEDEYFFECNAFIVRSEPEEDCFAGVFVDMHDEDRLAVAQYFEEDR